MYSENEPCCIHMPGTEIAWFPQGPVTYHSVHLLLANKSTVLSTEPTILGTVSLRSCKFLLKIRIIKSCPCKQGFP